MEAENKLKANIQGDGQEQPTPNTPLLQQQGQSHGYPQYGPTTMPVPPYYAPPSGAGYGVLPSQQRHVIVVSSVQPIVYAEPVESFVGALIYSCFVCWCCCPVFGFFGFILALVASDTAATNVQAARLRGASYTVSTLGIVVAIIIIGVYFGAFYNLSCNYIHDGVCYRHFSPYMTYDECLEEGGVYDDGCYYN